VPKQILSRAKRLSVAEAVSEFGADLLFEVSKLKLAHPNRRLKATKGALGAARPSPQAHARRG
jgi:hypothetical protein